jgi:small ligand-binding sensory domain FIST
MGVEPTEGYVAVGDVVRPGQTVQFHIRDAETARGELRSLLAKVPRSPDAPTSGALLFTCNGRGTRLFSQPNHDAAAIQDALGEIPLAGFFAAGEIGPIGGQNFLHGFTASLALLSSE